MGEVKDMITALEILILLQLRPQLHLSFSLLILSATNIDVEMATSPQMPRSSYKLYFRFYTRIYQIPALRQQLTAIDTTNTDLYKRFLRFVLNVNTEQLSDDKEKYLGNRSFAQMSREVGKSWRELDEGTRSLFTGEYYGIR